MSSASLRVAIMVAGVGIAASCGGLSAPCREARDVRGTWQYSAQQGTPVNASVSGMVNITGQSCGDFQGLADLVEEREGGRRRIAGPLSGVLLDSIAARFTVTLGTGSREHVAHLFADSITGMWVEVTAQMTASGSFRAHRDAP